MLVASGLSPYGGLYRVLSAPACGNRWGPSMDNLLPMYERKLSLPRKARSPLPGPPFSPFGWPGSRKARLHELLSAWRMFQTGSSEDVNVAPLRIFDNLHCGYWRRLHPVSPAHRQEARRGNTSNGPPHPSQEKNHPGHPAETRCFCCRWGEVRGAAALPPLPVGPECSKDLGPLVARGAGWAGCSKGWNNRCHCRAAASAGVWPPLLRRPVPGPCVGARQPLLALPAASAAVGLWPGEHHHRRLGFCLLIEEKAV